MQALIGLHPTKKCIKQNQTSVIYAYLNHLLMLKLVQKGT